MVTDNKEINFTILYLLPEYRYCTDTMYIYTVGVKSMSPADIELLFVILYNITALHHNTNLFS